MSMLYNTQLGMIANNSIMQNVIVLPNRKMQKKQKQSCGNSHPPLYCNDEEEVKRFGLKKEEVQTL